MTNQGVWEMASKLVEAIRGARAFFVWGPEDRSSFDQRNSAIVNTVVKELSTGDEAQRWLVSNLDAIGVEFGPEAKSHVLQLLSAFNKVCGATEALASLPLELEALNKELKADSQRPTLEGDFHRFWADHARLLRICTGSGDQFDEQITNEMSLLRRQLWPRQAETTER